jgi:small subunit ribosomal protein S1
VRVSDIQEDDFATLFAASEKTQARRLAPGQAVEGTIVSIGPNVALVDVGAKSEAAIAIEELRDDNGVVDAKVGERIQATVMSMADGITLSRKLQRGAASLRQLEDAFHAGLPVEGKVEGQVKGGYTVTVARQRAFCPISQIDTIRDTDPASHIGRVYTFRIIELKDNGRKFVVSRRALLEDAARARAAEVRATIAPGAILTGRVVSVRDFGAFVDLGGGVHGLLHVSEMSWSRVSSPAEVVAAGQEITVKVLRVDDEKIALGLKQVTADPWSAVPVNYAVGQVREGRVTRIAEFGAFVELEPGIEGLAHASTFAPTGRPGGWAKSIAIGTTGAFEILAIDLEKKRIGVAMVESGSSRANTAVTSRSAIVPGARLTGKVERHEPFGVFVFLAPGIVGLLPLSESGVAKDADIRKTLPVGSDIDVVVLEADPDGRRIRLSVKAIGAAEEAADVRAYAERASASETTSFGSLADKLRGALKPR